MSSNLRTRTITSIVYVLVMTGGILLGPVSFGALFLLVMTQSLSEFYSMAFGGRYRIQKSIAILTAGILFIMHYSTFCYGMNVRWLTLALIPLLCIPVSFMHAGNHSDFGLASHLYTGILYILLPFLTGMKVVFGGADYNGKPLMFIFVVIWLCDAGAYMIGSTLGQRPSSRKLAPSISPKKSMYGLWGGILCGTMAALVMDITGFVSFGMLHSLVLGILISISSVVGDLAESLWKRCFGVKDSGSCIPGHGGMLDRFDSSLLAIPAATIYLILFSLI